MKMVLDDAEDLNLVGAYAPGEVRIRGRHYATALLIYPRDIVADCGMRVVDDLDERGLAPIVERRPEVLIIGTGERQRFPEPRRLASLVTAQIGHELMDNAAACRTFNILLGEGRDAALLLLAEPSA